MRFDPSCRDSTWAAHRRLNHYLSTRLCGCQSSLRPSGSHRAQAVTSGCVAVPDSVLHPPFHSGMCERSEEGMEQTRSAVRMLSRRNAFSSRANDTTTSGFHVQAKIAVVCLSFGEEITGYLWLSAPWKPAKHWSCSPSLSSSPSSPKQCHTDSWGSSRRATWGSTGVWVLLTPGRLLGFLGLFFNDL